MVPKWCYSATSASSSLTCPTFVSKSVRLKEYLAAELERIAARENRSLANLVNHLLEQAVEMERRKAQRKPDRPSSGSLDGND